MIALAVVVGTHGTAGEIRMRPLSGEVSHFDSITRCELRKDGISKTFEIESVRPHQGDILVRIAGCSSIDDARRFLGSELWAERDRAASLGNDEYYAADLVGCAVVDGSEHVGRIISIYDGVQAPLLEISVGAKSVLVPFMDQFIGSVDTDTKRVELRARWILESE